MFFFVVFVVLFFENCNGILSRHSEKNTITPEVGLYIDIQANNESIECSKNCDYTFIIGTPINITCRQNTSPPGPVRWIDPFGFETGWSEKLLKLEVTPDEDDINLEFKCSGYVNGHLKDKPLKLVVDPRTKTFSKPGIVTYLNVGKPWTSNNFYSIAFYPPTEKTENYRHSNKTWHSNDTHRVIESFNKDLNGTVLYCIDYNKVNTGQDDKNTPIKFLERVKTKYTFYLNPTSETGLQNEYGDNNSGSHTAAIVGGAMGSVIFVLAAALACIWYKHRRQRPSDDGASQVIYAEIEERSNRPPPPPPRNPVPYAQIIGTLTPKQPTPTEDPYTTVQCTVKDNPYTSVYKVKENLYTPCV